MGESHVSKTKSLDAKESRAVSISDTTSYRNISQSLETTHGVTGEFPAQRASNAGKVSIW